MFMGDVGSLSLGAALGIVAVMTKNEIVLMIVGGVFVIEALSVIFQVVSYKMRRKRVFLMAPIHHHYELKGWKEPQIIVRFWILSIILRGDRFEHLEAQMTTATSQWTLTGKKVLVIGLARTGRECARFLAHQGAQVTVSDLRRDRRIEAGDGSARGAADQLSIWAAKKRGWLDGMDYVVPSPGVPTDNLLLREAVLRHIPVLSEIELAYRFFRAPLIAITGTNGKSTTTTLIGAMLKADGRKSFRRRQSRRAVHRRGFGRLGLGRGRDQQFPIGVGRALQAAHRAPCST